MSSLSIEVFLSIKDTNIVNTSVFRLKQEYNPKKNTLHMFFENEDDFLFYRSWVRYYFPDYILLTYYQNGKDGVNDTYKALDWTVFKRERVLFFRDKDYDDLLNVNLVSAHNFFITKYYSIENYLVDKQVFDIILTELFNFKHEKTVDDLKLKFQSAYNVFIDNMLLITAWILIYRKNNRHMCLDDLKMGEFFYSEDFSLYYKKIVKPEVYIKIKHDPQSSNLDRFTIRAKKTKMLLEELTGADAQYYSLEIMLQNYRMLKSQLEPKTYIRGKFEMWFFIECCLKNLKSYVKALNDKIKQYNKDDRNVDKITKIECKVDIEDRNVFLIIPPLMKEIPEDINAFLLNNRQHLYGNN